MPEAYVRLEYQGNVATITLDRPRKRNALNEGMFSHLEAVTAKLKTNPPRVVILTGEGDAAFCAGFDVSLDNPMNEYLLQAAEKKRLIFLIELESYRQGFDHQRRHPLSPGEFPGLPA